MDKKTELSFDFSQVPGDWHLCFNEGCPQSGRCLHFLAGRHVPATLTQGPAVYPTAWAGGQCRHFKETRTIRAAYGLAPLFRAVRKSDYATLRSRVMDLLGGHSAYYRYNRGERLLTPEQQQGLKDLFASLGYGEELQFEGYREIIDFS